MRDAEVSVNSPIAQRRAFTYAIPPGLIIEVGQAVWVPFGDRILQGIVLEVSPTAAIETKDITGVIEPLPLLSPARVSLARWISEYYLSPLFDAVAPMLPPGFERKAITLVQPTGKEPDTLSITEEQKKLFESVQKQGRVELRQLEKTTGKKKAQAIISQLVRLGLLARSYQMEPVKVKTRMATYISLATGAGQAREEAVRVSSKGAKQAALLDFLALQSGPVPLAEARQKTGCTKAVADALVSKGLIELRHGDVRR